MPENKPERRRQPRVTSRIPVKITASGESSSGCTRDLSTSGVFLYTDAEIAPGTELEMVLMLPPELANGEKRWVCCQASVARVEPGNADGRFGAAATIRRL